LELSRAFVKFLRSFTKCTKNLEKNDIISFQCSSLSICRFFLISKSISNKYDNIMSLVPNQVSLNKKTKQPYYTTPPSFSSYQVVFLYFDTKSQIFIIITVWLSKRVTNNKTTDWDKIVYKVFLFICFVIFFVINNIIAYWFLKYAQYFFLSVSNL